MIILRVLEYSVIVLLIVLVITQVLVPLFRGTKVFPLFRREGQLVSKLIDTRQQKVEKGLEQKIAREKRKK